MPAGKILPGFYKYWFWEPRRRRVQLRSTGSRLSPREAALPLGLGLVPVRMVLEMYTHGLVKFYQPFSKFYQLADLSPRSGCIRTPTRCYTVIDWVPKHSLSSRGWPGGAVFFA